MNSKNKTEEITVPVSVYALASWAVSTWGKANLLVIDNDKQYQSAGLDIEAINKRIRRLNPKRKKMIRSLDEVTKETNQLFDLATDTLNIAKKSLTCSMKTYQKTLQ